MTGYIVLHIFQICVYLGRGGGEKECDMKSVKREKEEKREEKNRKEEVEKESEKREEKRKRKRNEERKEKEKKQSEGKVLYSKEKSKGE